MTPGEKIKAVRGKFGLSRDEIGQLLNGASYGKIARLERGKGSLSPHESTCLEMLYRAAPMGGLGALIVQVGAVNAFHRAAFSEALRANSKISGCEPTDSIKH